ncbi:hypothetical protein C8Q73DRAFT_697589 [Cubamyces lactineus]|nr:hypothetical protein C8Q73DRAFT_697589 [Cubamyces lactineus]
MTILSAPSARLPPIRRIHEHSADVLEGLVKYLRTIYNPPVRGTRRVDRKLGNKTLDGARQDEDALAVLRSDEFERAYTVRWLTGLIAQASLIQDGPAEDEGADLAAFEEKVDVLIRNAASLLAVCAGTAAAGTVTRRFSFGTPLLDSSIEVQLTDIPISVESDAATVGAHTWGSACLLAEMIAETPERYGLAPSADDPQASLRILELGAGTGLVSLASAKLLSAVSNKTQQVPTVVATDYHPAVLENLAYNIKANFPDGIASGVSLSAHALDWSIFGEETLKPPALDAPLDEPFDIIFGADIVYEIAHARWIRNTVAALLRRPTTNTGPQPCFYLLIPLRPTHVLEARAIEDIFPRVSYSRSAGNSGEMELCILDVESILCETEDRRAGGEVEYLHYRIGWA